MPRWLTALIMPLLAFAMFQHEALEVLELKRGATDTEIKKAYRRLSLIHHPDKGGDADYQGHEHRPALRRVVDASALEQELGKHGAPRAAEHQEPASDLVRAVVDGRGRRANEAEKVGGSSRRRRRKDGRSRGPCGRT